MSTELLVYVQALPLRICHNILSDSVTVSMLRFKHNPSSITEDSFVIRLSFLLVISFDSSIPILACDMKWLWCLLRRIEMTRINLKTDLEENAEGMVLHVHGKGNKERILPVPARLAATLRKRTGVWLFPGDVQGHCGVDYVAKRIKTVTGYPSHSLRRRFATCVYYRNGCNIVLVSRMLGHANIATTMRYIGLVQDEMRNAVESTTRTDMRLTMPMNQVVGTAGSVATYSLSTARIG